MKGLPRLPLEQLVQAARHPHAGRTGWLAAAQYLSMGLGFLTALLAARELGPRRFGEAALVMAFPSLVSSFTSVKSTSITVRHISQFKAAGRRAELKSICKLGYGLDALTATVAFGLIALSSPWVFESILRLPVPQWLPLAFAASLIPLSMSGTSMGVLSSFGKFRTLGTFQMVEKGLLLALVAAVITVDGGVTGLVLAYAAANMGAGFLFFAGANRAMAAEGLTGFWKERLVHISELRSQLRRDFGWHFWTVSLAGLLVQGPLFLLGKLNGPAAAGFFRMATNIVGLGANLEGSLNRVTYPAISERWGTGDREGLRETFRRWTVYAGIPLGLVVLGGIPLLPLLVPAVLGPEYRPMIFGTQLMTAGTAVSVAFFYVSPYFYASGQVGLWSKAVTVEVAFVLAAAWVLTSTFGFSGAAAATALGTIAFNLTMAHLLFKKERFETTASTGSKPAVGRSA